jgi:hypothetical protein
VAHRCIYRGCDRGDRSMASPCVVGVHDGDLFMCARRRPHQPSQPGVCVGCDDPTAALSDSEVCRKLGPDHPHVQHGGEGRRGADGAHFACRVGRAAAVRPPARRNLRRATHRLANGWSHDGGELALPLHQPLPGTAALNSSNSDSSTRRGLTLRARYFENPAETTTPPAPRSPRPGLHGALVGHHRLLRAPGQGANLDQARAKPQLIAPGQNTPKRDLSQVYLLCLENQTSARQGRHCEPDAGSVLGQPVLPVRQCSALQVAIGRGAPPNCECAAEAAHERRRMLIDPVP